jgi:hypothetical protein
MPLITSSTWADLYRFVVNAGTIKPTGLDSCALACLRSARQLA